MLCDICQRPAAGKCSGCGAFCCADHGGQRCFRCAGAFMAVKSDVVEVKERTDTAIYTSDKDSRYAGKGYLQCFTKPGMQTIYIDDPGPPACHLCESLAKAICSNCQQLFCAQHRGTKNLCQSCARSSRLGLWILFGMLLAVALLIFLNRWN
jgi:hypothetical protein